MSPVAIHLDLEVFKYYYVEQGKEPKELAEIFDVSISSIVRFALKHEEELINHPKFSNVTSERLQELYITQKLSRSKVANILGLTDNNVRHLLRKYNIVKGTQIKFTTLSNEFMDKAVELYLSGDGSHEVAKKLNTNQTQIRRILHLKGINLRSTNAPRKGKKNAKIKGYAGLTAALWRRIDGGAKIRKIPLLITPEQAWNLFLFQNKLCSLTGLELIMAASSTESIRGGDTASLDRIDSSKPYTISNVQWVHKDVNRMKSNFAEDYFFKICQLIIKCQESKKVSYAH